VSQSMSEALLQETAAWNLFDANARVGPSGIYGELALEADALIEEMKHFSIRQSLVSHWAGEEYDATEGNIALEQDLRPQLTPAWAVLPEQQSIDCLAARKPLAVRLTPGVNQHNYSLARWCSGPLFEYLEEHSVITMIGRMEIEWDRLVELLENFPRLVVGLLDTGYRVDRYLFPLLKRFPNLYFDSATYLAHRQLETFVKQYGPDRILFGSRLPLYTPAASLGVLASARMSDDARLAIAGRNLRRLLAGCRNACREVRG
jgi:uncharacterized protein